MALGVGAVLATLSVEAAPARAVEGTLVAKPQTVAASTDLRAIRAQLKATPALGWWTKLRVSFAVQSIRDDVRRYYDGEADTDLPSLRRRFDALVHEVVHQLQGGDPVLAWTIVNSREAIWEWLTRR